MKINLKIKRKKLKKKEKKMSRVVHYTSVGFKPQLIEIASDCENKESKRSYIIEEEDKNLNKNLNELEEGTRARNREIIKRLVRYFLRFLYIS